jgi:hypothetical protein
VYLPLSSLATAHRPPVTLVFVLDFARRLNDDLAGVKIDARRNTLGEGQEQSFAAPDRRDPENVACFKLVTSYSSCRNAKSNRSHCRL